MTNLTEQFLNDEIDESKLYYFKQKMSEEIEVGTPFSLNMVRALDGTYLDWFLIDEVLEEVPSYEQWQEYKNANDSMFDTIKMLNKDNYKLEEENTKLKELLKQSRVYVLIDTEDYEVRTVSKSDREAAKKLLSQIDEVLK